MSNPLIQPEDCCVLLVDPQPGLAFAVQSQDRQLLLNNLKALVATTQAFSIPLVVSTSATRVYSGPVISSVRKMLPSESIIDRRTMNSWEDDRVRQAIESTGRKHLLIAGLLTEACVSFPALHAQDAGYGVSVVADACGGATNESHSFALQRMFAAGIPPISWLQLLLELQRDWTRTKTYAAARAIVEEYGGGYGIGLGYARDMIPSPQVRSPGH